MLKHLTCKNNYVYLKFNFYFFENCFLIVFYLKINILHTIKLNFNF